MRSKPASSFSQPLALFLADPARAVRPSDRFLIACSGGPDSVALSCFFATLFARDKGRVVLAHINHRLRGRESEKDAFFVQRLAKKLGVAFDQEVCPAAAPTGNLEARARHLRYAALAKLAKRHHCRWVATAHTLDDQSETILMNLLRGAGPEGLVGMEAQRPLAPRISLLRPLLTVPKQEIRAFLSRERQSFRVDQSNNDEAFFRNWVRRRLVPLLEKRAPGFAERLQRLSTVIREEEVFWASRIDAIEQRWVRAHRGGRLLDFKGPLRYSAALQRRLLRRMTEGIFLDFESIERLRRWMNRPPGNGRLWPLRKGWVVERLSKSRGFSSSALYWFHHPAQSAIRQTKSKR